MICAEETAGYGWTDTTQAVNRQAGTTVTPEPGEKVNQKNVDGLLIDRRKGEKETMKKTVSTKLSVDELARLDACRGSKSIAEYVRETVIARMRGTEAEGRELAGMMAQIRAGLARIEANTAAAKDLQRVRALLVHFVESAPKSAEYIRQIDPALLGKN